MLLELQSLNKVYRPEGRQVEALRDVSLNLDGGQFVALRGKSGCGKSTLLLSAGGLLRPDSGQVILDGHDLYSIPPERRARLRGDLVGFVFQQFHLVPYLNVLENVLAATLGVDHARNGVLDRARELLVGFGMEQRLRHRPPQLSTGERQRTALARALLNEPKLLLADEPTGNLDEENSEAVLKYMRQYVDQGGAILLATHDDRATRSAQVTLDMNSGVLADAVSS